MEDRYEEVLKQYDLKIYNSYRTRGAFILETNHGIKLCKNFDGSKNRVEIENLIMEHLRECGYSNVDMYLYNIENEIVTLDSRKNQYVLKDWYLGDECNLKDIKDTVRATKNLGLIHTHMQGVTLSEEEKRVNYYCDLNELFEKHNRELKRVRRYIRDKKVKNEFEVYFLNVYDVFLEQGYEACKLLKDSHYEQVLKEAMEKGHICHGNYTYHNIIFLKEGEATTNFEKASLGIQIFDLYQFLRKVMEKTDWNINYGISIINEYEKVVPLSKESMEILYILILYPEKFWKITNYYYNSKKSWVPQKNIQKLIHIGEQTEIKTKFLDQFKKEYLC